MLKKLPEDAFVGFVVVVIGLAIFFQGSTYNAPSVDPLGSNFYPRMIGGMLIVGGFFMSFISLITLKKGKKADKIKENRKPISRKAIGLFLLACGYIVFIGKVGFFLTNIIFMISCLMWLGERNLLKLIFLTIGFTVLLLFIFHFLLRVTLPGGTSWGL